MTTAPDWTRRSRRRVTAPRRACARFGPYAIGAVLALALHAVSAFGQADVAEAARSRNWTAVTTMLEADADVNAALADGSTALHWAVRWGDSETIDRLIAAGADVEAADRTAMTPLFLAAINGSARAIADLIAAGANPNASLGNGETVLMMASRTGNPEAIGTLLDAGADVGAREKLRGTTALMWAAAEGHADAIAVLVAGGAAIDAHSGTVAMGRGPYLAPTARSRIEGARREAETTARANFDNEDAATVDVDAANVAPQASFGGRDAQTGGLTALMFAVRNGNRSAVEALVEAGADVNATSEDGWTPLLMATQNRRYALGVYLLDHGADPNIDNRGGWTPLYIATDNRNIEGGDYPTRKPDLDHLEFIETLLERGADPNRRMRSSTETRTVFTHQWLYEEGATPFLRAAQSGDLPLMRLLLEHGADPSIATDNNTTPLMVASGIGWVEGVTHEWSREQTIEAVELILSRGADVNAQDNDGRTALMGAAHKGVPEVVEILVDAGADLATRDFGSRDSIHLLEGVTWQAIDYADGLVRVGVQSAVTHPETAALIRAKMIAAGLEVPPEGRTLDSICVTDLC